MWNAILRQKDVMSTAARRQCESGYCLPTDNDGKVPKLEPECVHNSWRDETTSASAAFAHEKSQLESSSSYGEHD